MPTRRIWICPDCDRCFPGRVEGHATVWGGRSHCNGEPVEHVTAPVADALAGFITHEVHPEDGWAVYPDADEYPVGRHGPVLVIPAVP